MYLHRVQKQSDVRKLLCSTPKCIYVKWEQNQDSQAEAERKRVKERKRIYHFCRFRFSYFPQEATQIRPHSPCIPSFLFQFFIFHFFRSSSIAFVAAPWSCGYKCHLRLQLSTKSTTTNYKLRGAEGWSWCFRFSFNSTFTTHSKHPLKRNHHDHDQGARSRSRGEEAVTLHCPTIRAAPHTPCPSKRRGWTNHHKHKQWHPSPIINIAIDKVERRITR